VPDAAGFCPRCGAPAAAGGAAGPPPGAPAAAGTGPAPAAVSGISDKRILPATLLCLLLGMLGVHRFYVGKIGTGILTIVTVGGFFGIWPLIDFVMIVTGSFSDQQGRRLVLWT